MSTGLIYKHVRNKKLIIWNAGRDTQSGPDVPLGEELSVRQFDSIHQKL